ncbi:MAG: type I polyketide synthase, partial [Gemmatimonadaceae bacterium]
MSNELTPLQRAFLALEETRAKLATSEAKQREPIAIVGMGCRFPGSASNPEAFWQLLQESRSAVTTVPVSRWEHAPYLDVTSTIPGTTNAQHAGFIDTRVDAFDARFFGISPREAAAMDPQQRLLLEVTWEALENAGIAPDGLAGTTTGVFVGMPSSDYAQLQMRGGTMQDIDAHYASGIAHSIAAGRLSYLLGWNGPSLAIDTACSSSLVSVHLACQSLRSSDSDLAIAGGVNLILSPDAFVAFGRSHMLATDGRCKAFDDDADGFVRGEGCGVVVLKRLSDAVKQGDRILAVIRGSAVNQDGASASLTAPSGPAQEMVIRKALAQAALSPNDVQFVEAHGTGTALGDPIELRALGAVYGAERAEGNPLLVGSVKANIGHLEGAAGVASLIKAILALNTSRIPGQLHVERPTTHVHWEALRLRLPAVGGEAWPTVTTRRAAVSAFGFSGTNAHVVLEAPPEIQQRAADVRPIHIIPIAARSRAAVQVLAAAYAPLVSSDSSLADAAFTLSTGRAQLVGARSAVVARNPKLAHEALVAIAAGENITTRPPGFVPRAAFLFTGQGAQSARMSRELYETYPDFTASINSAATTLAPIWNGVTLYDVLYGAESEQLLQNARYVQPALIAVESALAALWQSWGVEPAMVAGHSLGEYAAAAFAGVMSVDDALRLVATRGQLMAELPATSSAMTSIAAGVATVRDALGASLGTHVELAADNGPTQCVLTGEASHIAIAEAKLRAALGIEPRRLANTTNAFHSRYIEPMLDAFEAAAAAITFAPPRIPIIWNLGESALAPHQAPDARYWRLQTRHTVQFGEVIAALRTRGITHAIEIGPHPVLSGLVVAVDDRTLPVGLASLRRGRGAWETLATSVAQWWQEGGAVNWAQFNAPYHHRPIALPTYPFEREHYWLEYARVGATPRTVPATPPREHPLVGVRVTSPAINAVVFESEVSVRGFPLLEQHRIHGRATLPGAAWLDAMIVAGKRAVAERDFSVYGLTLHTPLTVADDGPRVVQLVLQADSDGRQQVSAYGRDASAPDGPWTLHAQAALIVAPIALGMHDVALVEDNAQQRIDMSARLARVGLTLGEQFQLIQRATKTDGGAVGIIDAACVPVWTHGLVHPAIIDACIQVIGLATPDQINRREDLFMPFAVEQFDWITSRATEFICEATLRPASLHGETVVADVLAYGADGNVIGRLTGVTLKRASQLALRPNPTAAVRDSLYEIQWEHSALATSPTDPAIASPSLESIAQHVVQQSSVRAAAESLDRYATDGPAMDHLAALYIWRALQHLGATLRIDARFTAIGLADVLEVLPRHQKLFARFLDILVEDGALVLDRSHYVVKCALDTGAIDGALGALQSSATPFSGELALLVRCGESLAPALTGAIDALTLLFPDGSLEAVHRIYRDSPFPRTYNALVRDAIVSLVAERGLAEPLRILEVGGGTGGTTSGILDAIPDGRCAYVFTDASPLFLTHARERFATRSDIS